MDLPEWTAKITEELRAAGFHPTEYRGFPLMKLPEGHFEIVRLLKFRTSLAADRRIYAEGMIFIPAGSWDLASKAE
jgi:hypothetical protein